MPVTVTVPFSGARFLIVALATVVSPSSPTPDVSLHVHSTDMLPSSQYKVSDKELGALEQLFTHTTAAMAITERTM
jgi:hypothetical protein